MADLGWPGTMGRLRPFSKRTDIALREIRYGLATHYPMEHPGLAQELKQAGGAVLVLEMQLTAIPLTPEGLAGEASAATVTASWGRPRERGALRIFLRHGPVRRMPQAIGPETDPEARRALLRERMISRRRRGGPPLSFASAPALCLSDQPARRSPLGGPLSPSTPRAAA